MGLFDIFKSNKKENTNKLSEQIFAPITGEVKNIGECADPVFAQELVGKGLLLLPSEGKLYSPVDGTISMLAETGHAVGITSELGAEILIHVGLDTVELQGGPFTVHLAKDAEVKKGDLVLEFDMDQIKASGKATESPVIVTNPDDFDLSILAKGPISHGDPLMEIKKK